MTANSAAAEERLAVFAKAPRLGKVKTRLSPPLTVGQALELHRALVEVTLERMDGLDRPSTEYWLYVSEPLETPHALAIPPKWRMELQEGQDLGARLENAFRRGFNDGVERLVVIGSDSPTLPLQCIDDAFDYLDRYDAVLGPSLDGGYYLLGASQFMPGLFRGISWGKPTVLQETAEALNRGGHSFTYLIDWYDVDTDEDLMRLREEIAYYARECPRETPRRIEQALPEETGLR